MIIVDSSPAVKPPAIKPPAELDLALRHLREHGNPDLALDGAPVQLHGGFWAEMWTLPLEAATRAQLPAKVVLRVAPDAQLAAWETTFQAGVAEQGYPTPRIRAFDYEPRPDQRAWCVMDHADGVPLLAGLSGARALLALPRLATGLPDTLARSAAELHRLDPAPVETDLARTTGRAIGVDGLLEHYSARSRELADISLQRTVERLSAARPSAATRVLCHGDLHPFNVLTTSTGHVVLDWTSGQIAHPAYDLAFTHLLVANPPLATPTPLRPIVTAAARRLADRFITTYRKLSAHTVDSDTLDWYRTLHACRIMTDIIQWRVEGTLDAHQGHPLLAMEPVLRPLLEA